MKTLPLWQPWATLVVTGEKTIETRHWTPPAALIGQRIGIHATKTKSELLVCRLHHFAAALERQDVAREQLPLGAIVGSAVLLEAVEMTADFIAELRDRCPAEYSFGHYAPGRFAWALADPIALDQPVTWKGSQGIFNVPDEMFHL